MEYRKLGQSGLKVSELCLGTMTFGQGTLEPDAVRMVQRSLEEGVNFFDTADSYGEGEAESLLGKALAGRRREAVIGTKFFNPSGSGVNDSGMSRVHIMNAVEDSLRRLATDWIDVYYIHHVDVETPLEEMLRALDDLVHQGKVRYIGCSNYEAWRLAEALSISEREGLARFICYQPQYSLVVRDIEHELVPLCSYKGLGVVAWSPLGGGFLAGRYRPGELVAEGTRSKEGWNFPKSYFAPSADETLKVLLENSKRIGIPPAQVALRWVLGRPAVASCIVGARAIEQLESNLAASQVQLPDEVIAALDEVSRPRPLYPASLEQTMVERRRAAVVAPQSGPAANRR